MFQKLPPLLRLNGLEGCQLGLDVIQFQLRLCDLLKQFQSVVIVLRSSSSIPGGIDRVLEGLTVGVRRGNLLLHRRPIVLHQLRGVCLDEWNVTLHILQCIARFVNGPIERRVLVQ